VVDQPRVGPQTASSRPRVTREPAYLRLHGRNRDSWFREGAGRDARYDYLYTPEELIVVQNNHFRGQALVNALQLAHRLRSEPPPAPESLVRIYPQLTGSVRVEHSRLF